MADYFLPDDDTEFVDKYRKLVYQHIGKLYEQIDATPTLELDDVYQTVMMRLLEMRHNYNPSKGAASTWIAKCTWGIAQRCIDQERWQKTRSGDHLFEGRMMVPTPDLSDTGRDPNPARIAYDNASATEDDLTHVEAAEALNMLTGREKDIFLSNVAGESLRSIGERYGYTDTWAKNKLDVAKVKMRGYYAGRGVL